MKILLEMLKWVKGLAGRVRQALDAEAPPESVPTAASSSGKQAFIVKVARAVEDVMRSEMVIGPVGNRVYVPSRYIAYLSGEDNAEWVGRKRQILEEELRDSLAARAGELVGGRRFSVDAIRIELGLDPTLGGGDVRVQPVLDDSDVTEVLLTAEEPTEVFISSEDGAAIYALEVQHAGQATTIPVTKRQIRIGRGSASVPVDVTLKHPAISRLHGTIEVDEHGEFWFTRVGANETKVAGREALKGARVPVGGDDEIRFCDFVLRIAGDAR
jgi:hypothetical protein